jgi:hypothetical protein
MWATFVCFVAALLVLGVWRASVGSESVLRESRVAVPGAAEAFVTREFTLGGRTSNVEVTINTDLENGWAYFSLALVNEVAGTAFDFGREVSYYHGVDQGESWSEGSRRDRVRIPSVPPGVYYLRVAPELPPDATRRVGYELAVRRDVPAWPYFGIVLLLLALPPVFAATRVAAFESARWAESDYASGGGSDEDDD